MSNQKKEVRGDGVGVYS